MCLILFSWKTHPDYKLIVAANRDEFYKRPTRPAEYWGEHPEILAGKDLEAGGTWLGVTTSGRFTAITNYRNPDTIREKAPSRGHLTADFLKGGATPRDYLEQVSSRRGSYNGFNLLVGDQDSLWYYSNITDIKSELEPGSYGLSNALLDTDWPKVKWGMESFRQLTAKEVEHEPLLDMMTNKQRADDEQLPQTGIPYEWEKAVSAMFIETEKYGTCCTTIMTLSYGSQVEFTERNYPVGNRTGDTKSYDFKIS